MQVGIIGLGNIGTAIANLIAENGYKIIGWEKNPEVVNEINTKKINSTYLPGINLNPNIIATTELEEVLNISEILFIAIPSIFINQTLKNMKNRINTNCIIVNLAKGIDNTTYFTSCEILSNLFPNNNIVMLSGPSIANEFSKKMPTVVVLAHKNKEVLLTVSKILENEYFRLRFSDDIIGVELGGILKNIYAIGLGILDGKKITSINFRAVYLTMALEEMIKLGSKLKAKPETFYYLSGLGDLIATSLSTHSHNRKLGELLANNLTLAQIKEKMKTLPEGYNTLKIILNISEKYHVPLPLAKSIWEIINQKYPVEKFISLFIKDFIENK